MIQNSPVLFLIGMISVALLGFFISFYGSRLGRKNLMITGLAMLGLFVSVFLGAINLLEGFPEVAHKIKLVGWIWPKTELGAVQLGLVEDFHGLSISALTWFVSAVFLLSGGAFFKVEKIEQIYASTIISTAGVMLAWHGLTPWICFVGILMTIWAGFISLPQRWGSQAEAEYSARFLFERLSGLILSLLGACILVGTRSVFSWETSEIWSSSALGDWTDLVGGWALVLGLWMQFQPFPFLGLLMSSSAAPHSSRILLTLIYPALSAFAVFNRMETQLRNMDIFPVFGWVALGSVFFTVFAAVFQKNYKITLNLWISSGLSIALAILAFSGTIESKFVLMGVVLGGAVFANITMFNATQSVSSKTKKRQFLLAKTMLVLALLSSTGMVGFISAGGYLRWMMNGTDLVLHTIAFSIVLFLFIFLGWRCFRGVVESADFVPSDWTAIIMPFVLILESLGLLWNGTWSGGVVFGGGDRAYKSLQQFFYPGLVDGPLPQELDVFNSASVIYWGIHVFALISAFLISQDFFISRFSVLTHFLGQAYRVDRFFAWIRNVIYFVGVSAQKNVDKNLWGIWIPRGMLRLARMAADVVFRFDLFILNWLKVTSKKSVDAPALAVQLVQNGSIQWYLSFALGMGVVILLNFLIR